MPLFNAVVNKFKPLDCEFANLVFQGKKFCI